MAKQNRKNANVQIVDNSIQIRTVDRSRKTLDTWKTALLSAESILNPNRQQLYNLYEDIILDEHLTSVMDQRRMNLTNTTLTFGQDGKENKAITRLIDTEAFEQLLEHIVDSRFFGFSLIQNDFATIINEQPQIKLVPRAHVKPTFGIVVANPGDTEGIDYTQPPYDILYTPAGRGGDLGLLLRAAPLVLLKRGDVSDWATFNEVFGQPLRIAYYNPMDPTQKPLLEKGMAEMGTMAYMILPDGAKVEFPTTYQTAAADTYERFAERMDKAISKLIVGQTMTTEDGSSLSQSEVHERTAGKIAQSDRRFALRILNSRIKPALIAQGYSIAEGELFSFVDEEEQLSKKDRLSMDIQIHKNVAPIKLDYFAEEYNVPIDEEALKVRQEQAERQANQPPAQPAKPGKQPPKKVKQSAADEFARFVEYAQVLREQGFFDEAP
ncbi:phage portal protein family protein [Larkinella sp. VNQ87]|uniref:phage portal protein family protein n=1 Tax=Larkinella sp. VNQ87 TaxID=3400921 RepID=UPI003C0D20EF